MSEFINFPDIESKRLIIDFLKPDHAHSLFEPFSDHGLYNYISWEVPDSVEKLREKFERICTGHSPDKTQIWLNWVAYTKVNGDYSGFYEATIVGAEAMLAYYTFKPHQKKGLAKEGISAVMQYLIQNYSIKKFVVEIDTRNRASIKLAESLGFKWVKTIDNACELKGKQSHEFRFELSV